MIPIIPIVIVGGVLVVTYAGASILVMVATATVGLGVAAVLGAVGYKMVRNTKGGCDLFSTKKCKKLYQFYLKYILLMSLTINITFLKFNFISN